MTAPDMPRLSARPHWLALDGLRGCAVILVLIDHAGFGHGRALGATGVTIFFVLSGFLITNVITSAQAADRWSPREFYGNRAVRLFPALLIMVAVISAWWLISERPPLQIAGYAASAILYLQDFLHAPLNGTVFDHTWSLAVEEQFYLLWPFLLPLAKTRRGIIFLTLVPAVLSIALRWALAGFGLVDFAYAFIATNAYALLLGCAAALLGVHFGRAARWIGLAATVLLVALILSPYFSARWIVAPPIVAVLAAVLLIAVLPGSRVFELRPLRFVGRISYALYLWHWPLLVMTGTVESGVRSLPVIAASVCVAVLSTLLLEEPLRRGWRARRGRRQPQRAVVG